MHEIPEKLDVDKVTRACDVILKHMRMKHSDPELVEQMAILCAFVNRMKAHMEYMEALVQAIRDENSRKVPPLHVGDTI